MSAPIKHQIIEQNGTPLFVVVPYDEYINLITHQEKATVPHEVAKRYLMDDISLVKAWREHAGITQKQMSERMGITQSAYAQMEKNDAKLKKETKAKIASALGITPSQLDID